MHVVVVLLGLGFIVGGVRMAYDVYLSFVGRAAIAPHWFTPVAILLFLTVGALATASAVHMLVRPRSIYAAVYADRLQYSDGFKVREVSLSDVATAVYEAEPETTSRVYVYLNSGSRLEVWAAVLLDVPERNEFIELVNQLAAEHRR